MADKIIRLGTFVENISGTVISPEHAVGMPDNNFTGNTSGAWTAKWQLEAPDAPVQLTPYSGHTLNIYARRATMAGAKDPSIRSVVVKDQHGRVILSHYNGIQFTRLMGPVGWNLRGADKRLLSTILNRHSTNVLQNDVFVTLIDFTGADDVLLGVAYATDTSSGVRGLYSLANYSTDQIAITRIPFEFGGQGSWASGIDGWRIPKRIAISPSKDMVVVPTAFPYGEGLNASDEPIWDRYPFPTPNNTWDAFSFNRQFNVVFSPDGNRLLAVNQATAQIAQLWDIDRQAFTVTFAADQAPFNVSKTGSEECGCDWRGSLAVASVPRGLHVWNWDQQAGTFTEITGITGATFGTTNSVSDVQISPNGNYIALVRRINHTLYIYDVSDLGGVGPRSIQIASAGALSRLAWSPDSTTVFVVNGGPSSLAVNASYSGALLSVYVPASGPLILEAESSSDYPINETQITGVSFGEGKFGLIQHTSSQVPDNYIIDSVLDPSRARDVVGIPLYANPVLMGGKQLYFGHNSAYDGFRWHGGTTPDGNKFSPNRKYFVTNTSTGWVAYRFSDSWYNTPRVGVQVLATQNDAISQVSWAHDSTYCVVKTGGFLVLKVVENDATVLAPDPVLATSSTFFRPPTDGLDPHQHLISAFRSSGAALFYTIDTENDLIVDITGDFPVFDPGVGLFNWSADGKYLSMTTPTSATIYMWDDGSFTPCDSLATYSWSNWRKFDWHPIDKNLALFHATGFGTLPRLYELNGTTVDSIDITSFFDGLRTRYPSVQRVRLSFTHGGQYLMATFGDHTSANANITPDDGQVPAFFKWDLAQLKDTGALDEVHLPDTDQIFYRTRWRWSNDFDGVVDVTPFSQMVVVDATYHYHNRLTLPYGLSPDIDPEDIYFDEGWTIEIETWGDDNAIQLEGVELTLNAIVYQLPTPTLLPPVAVTGSSALLEWEWSSL